MHFRKYHSKAQPKPPLKTARADIDHMQQ